MKSILLIEDDHDTRVALREALEAEGYFLLTAGHGAAGLALLESVTPPSLIITDINMPVMNGDQLLATLKSDPRWADIPVMQVSAENNARRKGTCCSMEKPLNISDLVKMISSCFDDEGPS